MPYLDVDLMDKTPSSRIPIMGGGGGGGGVGKGGI